MSFPLATADKISCSLSVKCFELIERQSKETLLRHKLSYIQSLKFCVKFDDDNDQLTIIFKSKPSNSDDSHLYLRFDLSLTLLLISKSVKPNSIKYPYNFPKVSMSINSEKTISVSLTYSQFKTIYNQYQQEVPTFMFQLKLTNIEITPFNLSSQTEPSSVVQPLPAQSQNEQSSQPIQNPSTLNSKFNSGTESLKVNETTRSNFHDSNSQHSHIINSNGTPVSNISSYVGLQNQGSTCYLNSALQTLFHIPSFRKLVYDIPAAPDESPFIISLQRLFAKMQLCAEKSIPTFELTQSLGSNQEFNRQRDVQEFLSERFEALKTALQSNTSLNQRMMSLFYGEYEQTIRAININYQQSTTQQFREITLTVKGINNLAESLQQYISEERLTGDNQYDIPNHGKQDVILQKMFLQFPPVLFLHLSRFEHDSQTNQMKKINSRMEFPKTINLQPYLKENLQTQEYNYDLHGVIVHSGTPISGHYYAYLRPSTSPQWYQFNDTIVRCATEREAIENNYGGGSTTSPYGENTSSAYMLLYVKRSNENSIYESIPNDSIPSHWILNTNYINTSLNYSSKTFSFYDEDSIRANCIESKFDLAYSHFAKHIIFDRSSKASDVYDKVSQTFRINRNEFRIIALDHASHMVDILLNDSTSIAAIVYHQFLILKKPSNEPIHQNQTFVCIIKFFDNSLTNPIQFLGTATLELGTNIKKVLYPWVNNKIGLPETTKYDVYQSYPSISCITEETIHSPIDCLYFQLSKTETLPQTLNIQWDTFSDLVSLYSSKNIIMKQVQDPKLQNDSLVPFYNYDHISGHKIENVIDYFLSMQQKKEVAVYMYDDQTKLIAKALVPLRLSINDFKEFLNKALNLNIDFTKDSIILYYATISYISKISESPHANIENYLKSDHPKFYIRIIFGVNNSRLDDYIIVTAQFSANGYSLTKAKSVALRRQKATYKDLIRSLIEANDFFPAGFDKSSIQIFSCNNFLLFKPDQTFEELYNNLNTNSYRDPSIKTNETNPIIRFNIIPEDQKEVQSDETLIQIGFVDSCGSRDDKTGFPFFFKFKNSLNASQVIDSIRKYTGLPLVDYHLSIDDTLPTNCIQNILPEEKNVKEALNETKKTMKILYLVNIQDNA